MTDPLRTRTRARVRSNTSNISTSATIRRGWPALSTGSSFRVMDRTILKTSFIVNPAPSGNVRKTPRLLMSMRRIS